jgi:glycyl-tRNA synthetase beta chain
MSVSDIVNEAFAAFPARMLGGAQTDLNMFLSERLRSLLRERGYPGSDVEAVLAGTTWRLDQTIERLDAVAMFAKLPEAESLAAANKRITNILKKSEKQFVNADYGTLVEPAERALFDAVQSTRPVFDKFYAANNYTAALTSLAALKLPVDSFFEGVMVNVEDLTLRENRLALLGDLHALLNKVADLSKLAA